MDVAPYLLQIFNQSPEPQILVSGDGNVLAVNTAFTQLTGYHSSQLLEQPLLNFFTDNNAGWQDLLLTSGKSVIKLKLNQPQGKSVTIQLQITEMAGAAGSDRIWHVGVHTKEPAAMATSTADSSEGLYLENVLQSITDGFLVLNKNGDVLFCNQTAAQIMRIQSVADLIGKNIWEQVPALNVLKQYPGYDSVIQDNQPVRFKEYFPGYNFWVEISVYPSEHSVVVYFKDVNDIVRNKKIQSIERDVLAMNADPYKSLQALLDFYIHAIKEIYPGLAMILWKLENETLIHWSKGGIPEKFANEYPSISIADSRFLASCAVLEKKPLVLKSLVDSTEKDLRVPDMLAAGFTGLSATPLLHSDGEVLGILEVLYTPNQQALV
ncbi:MAG: PAS domain-containing protein, partial [Sediminibacterium sp.]|nr:PAS domain-containing protein [Sediminibacterium sp.]